ncbi:arylamine N-acetyltransferase family protein [Fodinicola acaciae]|uniref:arylamine N-acetyltransferase family protein n=1 Tax=Fodinicola acaciae TaxID=2681555 RepID=UPI0013D307E9|nr:arylamine N-acetyltransferase [Fodinicola acaciae]
MDPAAYLDRIGARWNGSADADSLRDLQIAHLRSVPFENLSIHLGETIVLDEEHVLAKIVDRRRGGFCYELNGAFGFLLSALGYRVTLLGARTYGGGNWGPPFDHMAIRVDLAEPWLVDVGFGRFTHHPIRLDGRDDQDDPGGTFRITEEPDGDLTVTGDGSPEYRLETRPRPLADFAPTCWWQQTSPTTHFTQSLVCSLVTDAGRVTLSGDTLTITTGADREEVKLSSDAEILAAYRDRFGIELDRVPTVRG